MSDRRPALLVLVLATLWSVMGAAEDLTTGSFEATDPATGEVLPFPLEHTGVEAVVSGTVAEVTVTQRFANPLATPLEAVYVFPLPNRAAVDDMSIRIGERLIRSEIRRREEARAIYDRARREGRLAGLLDQERPNIFTQRVANVLPGESVEVVLHYVEDLHYERGTWRLVFPTVVGPRYIPGGPTGQSGEGWSPDTDQVPDASRITPPVLPPGMVSAHRIDIRVALAPSFALADVASPSHHVSIARRGDSRATVTLAPLDRMPNKDFELTWRTGSDAIASSLLAHRVADEGYLTLILQAPAAPAASQVVPREVVFVLDTSGSMRGEPIAACKQLVRRSLTRLRPDDTFRLIQFANGTSQLASEPLPASEEAVMRGLSWLDGIAGGGGTEMLAGVMAALEAPADPARLRMVLFLTDGYIGNEAAILARITASLGDARLFSLGIGSSVNRYLLDRMAVVGRGVAEYLRPGEAPDALVGRFYERITDPVFTGLELDWGGLRVTDQEPRALPDLFAGQPLLVHARYHDGGAGAVTLRGLAGRQPLTLVRRVKLPVREPANAAQARLWARARIAHLELERVGQDPAASEGTVAAITELALGHRLMTAYTSLVAVDHDEVRSDSSPTTVQQPLPMPQGVSYEGVFGGVGPREELMKMTYVGGAAPVRQRMTRAMPIPDPSPEDVRPRQAPATRGSAPNSSLVFGVPESPPPPAPAARSGALPRAGADVPEPQVVQRVDPVYSEAARSAHVQGTVVLALEINEQGEVAGVTVLRGLPRGLTEAAVAAVRRWRFAPTVVDGRAIRVQHVVSVHFKLGSELPAPASDATGAATVPTGTAPEPAVAEEAVQHAAPQPPAVPVQATAQWLDPWLLGLMASLALLCLALGIRLHQPAEEA